MTSIRFWLLSLATLILSGCSWAHTYPQTESFIVYPNTDPAKVASAFVDANGTFYPSQWCQHLGRCRPLGGPRRWKSESLLAEAYARRERDSAFRDLIEREEARQLADFKAFGSNKSRIFILIHGFNDRPDEVAAPYTAIEQMLDLRPTDGVIRFYWDGLTANGVGPVKIWFKAVSSSQLAGERGLRRILEQFDGKDIYLISHSRGASVILSAIGDPIYPTKFRSDLTNAAAAWGHGDTLFDNPPLPRGNRLHVLMLAPAVGRVDFCDAREEGRVNEKRACTLLRPLDPVVSLLYTVNIDDPVLHKFVGLQYRLNPTTLGSEPQVGRAIADELPNLNMRQYFTDPPRVEHSFCTYVLDATFVRMLRDEKILKEPPVTPSCTRG